MCDFLTPGTTRLASLGDINNLLGTNMGILEHLEIRSWIGQLLIKFRNTLGVSTAKFDEVMLWPAKGSKKIRGILQNEVRDVNAHNFTRYATTITGNLNIGVVVKCIFPLWKTSFINYELSNFIFKYINNSINTRDRLSHFKNISPDCPLCTSTRTFPIQRDSTIHAFSACPTVNNLWTSYFRMINLDTTNGCQLTTRLVGYNSSTVLINWIVNLDLFMVRHFILKVRNLNLSQVNIGALKIYLVENRSLFAAVSTKYRAGIRNTEVLTRLKITTS